MIDVSYLAPEDRQTLGEDARYTEQILSKQVTVFFRPGNRDCAFDSRCIRKDSTTGVSYIGIIAEYGNHAEKRPPRLSQRLPCLIKEELVIPFTELKASDFACAYQEINSSQNLLAYFLEKYQLAEVPAVVTRYVVQYINQ